MFNFSKKEQNTDVAKKEKDEAQEVNDELEIEIKDSDIHVMPKKPSYERRSKHLKKFKEAEAESDKGREKFKKPHQVNWLFLGILIFIVLGSLITVIIIFYTYTYNQQTTSIENVNGNTNQQPTLNQNLNTSNTNTQNLNIDLATASARDQQRINNIQSLRTALDLYFAKYSKYPNSLNELLVDYLATLPQNPTPGGKNYTYVATEENSNYQILFSLEEGALYGTLNLTQGDYQATPSGISLVMMPPTNQNINVSPFPPITPSQPQTASDADNDYLTDIEENFYQTDPENSDTDGDSYLDGVEVRNLYNPLEAETKLSETGLIEVFTNDSYNYTIFYPKDWVAKALTTDYKEVMFVSSVGEFVSVLAQDNPLGLSAMNWYLSNLPGIDANALETLEVSGLPAVKSLDGLNTYLAIGNKIYIINYNIGNDQEKIFETTYKMMLKSFTLINISN